jgi:hypothetical protein
LLEYGCIDATTDDGMDEGAACTPQVVRVLKTNHMLERGYRMPDLYGGVPQH